MVSNSDAHSLPKLGREANVFDCELSYEEIISAIREIGLQNASEVRLQNSPKFLYTIEFFPEEGKYHFDGHRICGVCFSPEETKRHKGICPKCGRKLTVGVLNRVDELADRKEESVLSGVGKVPYKNLIPPRL